MSAPQRCPACDVVVEVHGLVPGLVTDVVPRAGDVSVCLYCARPARFDGDPLRLRKLTHEEFLEVMANEDVRRAISAVKSLGPWKPGGRR